MAPLTRISSTFTAVITILILSSCAHNFQKLSFKPADDAVAQVLRVRISGQDINEKLTVYTQINRTQGRAILDGVGTAGKHVFTLSSNGDKYEFIDHINDTQSSGDIESFELIVLDKDMLFKKLDINTTQPIIIKDRREETTIEIKIKEQRRLE